jgi:hypothetical protein
MHPSNIGAITFQWTRGDDANRVFRIRLDDGQNHYDFYVPCTLATCLYPMPARGWLAIAYAHPDDTLQATIEGTDGAGGARVSIAAIDVRFSPETVTGGLYYWTATSTGGTTYRLPFGASQASPFIVPSSPTNPLVCGGCHSVSRDGRMISFTRPPTSGSQVAFLAAAPRPRRPRPASCPDTAPTRRPDRVALHRAEHRRQPRCWSPPSGTSRCSRPRPARRSTSATPTRCCRPASWSRTPSGRRAASAWRSRCTPAR